MDSGLASVVVAVISGAVALIVAIKLRTINKRVGGIADDQATLEAGLYRRVVERMEADMMRMADEWKTASDQNDRTAVENSWLKESLHKAKVDLAHFERRRKDRDLLERESSDQRIMDLQGSEKHLL